MTPSDCQNRKQLTERCSCEKGKNFKEKGAEISLKFHPLWLEWWLWFDHDTAKATCIYAVVG